MSNLHSFHIPVMGIAYTIDSPLKVSKYGIDSVLSLGDDILLEKLRKMYNHKFNIPYQEISDKIPDYRALRITAYLNMLKNQTEKSFDELINVSKGKMNELKKYFQLLPDSSSIRNKFFELTTESFDFDSMKTWLKDNMSMGSIDVNIMTKLDKVNFFKGKEMPPEYNDAHAALRGFAQSDLSSSVIFSAGMNPRLYSYLTHFDDFFPDSSGAIKKKIVLKVSDYRSALIQGTFLAKKGLWVSEYRIESGLNCGGHAFATEGFLLGPILAEFRDKRMEFINSLLSTYKTGLESIQRKLPSGKMDMKFTAQGGVGTAKEHEFLLNHYQLDSIGWGSPFLLVPEATTVDEATINKLALAKEKDLYLSNISPLGVPFNNLRGNTKDDEKNGFIQKGRPGSSCPKKFLALNKEFTENSLCTASRQYQHLKLKSILEDESIVDKEKERLKVEEKSCICVGLGTSALLVKDLDTKTEGEGVSVCPGPNMAYFSKVLSLSKMTDHIYGRLDDVVDSNRPNLFLKEIAAYVDHLLEQLEDYKLNYTKKKEKYLKSFVSNLDQGLEYYKALFETNAEALGCNSFQVLKELKLYQSQLSLIRFDA